MKAFGEVDARWQDSEGLRSWTGTEKWGIKSMGFNDTTGARRPSLNTQMRDKGAHRDVIQGKLNMKEKLYMKEEDSKKNLYQRERHSKRCSISTRRAEADK